MEMQWDKKSCPYIKTDFRQVQSQEHTLELRLTEEMPDIGRVLCAWGQPVIRSKEWRNDGMSISGGINATVLYLPEDGSGMKTVECWIPLQNKYSFPQASRTGSIRVQPMLCSIEARTISPRKMMLRGNVSILAEALEPASAQITHHGDLPACVEVLTNVYPATVPVEAGEKQFVADELVSAPDAHKWIHFMLQPEAVESNVIGNRLAIRGKAVLHYVYLDEQGALHDGAQEVSISQFADLDREYDKSATADMLICVSSLEHTAASDGVHVQVGLTVQYQIWDRNLLEVTEDAYSPTCKLTVTDELLEIPVELDSISQNMRAEWRFAEGNVLQTTFYLDQPAVFREGNMAQVVCSGVFQHLYLDVDGNTQSAIENWMDEIHIPVSDGCQILVVIDGVEKTSSGANLDLKIRTCAMQRMPMVTAITVGEYYPQDPGKATLVLRRMDEGSLWSLAKATGSSMKAIRMANRLTEDPLPGQMLLIPVL